VAHTPFYTVRRLANYDRVTFYNNTTEIEQSTLPVGVEIGFTTGTAETYSADVGITLGAERGVTVGIEGSSTETKVSASLSVGLGFSKEVYQEWTGMITATTTLQIPPATAAALYVLRHAVELFRDDGTQVDDGPDFHENAFVAVQYPTTSTGSVAMSVQMEEAEAVPLG
jgi:hypothetical protein